MSQHSWPDPMPAEQPQSPRRGLAVNSWVAGRDSQPVAACTYPSCACAFLWCQPLPHPPCPVTGKRPNGLAMMPRRRPEQASGEVSTRRG